MGGDLDGEFLLIFQEAGKEFFLLGLLIYFGGEKKTDNEPVVLNHWLDIFLFLPIPGSS